jgi:hypothetical protein
MQRVNEVKHIKHLLNNKKFDEVKKVIAFAFKDRVQKTDMNIMQYAAFIVDAWIIAEHQTDLKTPDVKAGAIKSAFERANRLTCTKCGAVEMFHDGKPTKFYYVESRKRFSSRCKECIKFSLRIKRAKAKTTDKHKTFDKTEDFL